MATKKFGLQKSVFIIKNQSIYEGVQVSFLYRLISQK